MSSLLICAALASGLAAIASDWRQQRRPLFYLAKPLTTLLILMLAWLSLASAPGYRAWVVAALGCCLIGDVALMFTRARAFVLGLGSFLLGHLLLIAAFATDLPLAPLFVPHLAVISAGGFVLAVALYSRWLLPKTGRLQLAVLCYLLALTAMVLMAFARAGLSENQMTTLVAVGALLFAASDAVLAYRKFIRAPWWGQPVTLLTYYLAIGVIAWAH